MAHELIGTVASCDSCTQTKELKLIIETQGMTRAFCSKKCLINYVETVMVAIE